MDRNVKWFNLSLRDQISNIGGEVLRGLRYKENKQKSLSFVNKALELIDRTMMDPKNRNIIPELSEAKIELFDYFIGNNVYNTSEETLIKFYNSFL